MSNVYVYTSSQASKTADFYDHPCSVPTIMPADNASQKANENQINPNLTSFI